MNTHLLEAPTLNMLWTALMVEECVRNNVTMFCISPGSRSTPLVAAVAQNPKAQTIVCLDERAAAFYALGYARATGRAAALICTSGTAVANYMPAVVEAAQDNVPMLILTADRPPELRDTGANQTIPQPALFGDFVRWKFDLPCPDLAIPASTILTTIDQAIFRTRNSPAGAVHLNCMFREPLAPLKIAQVQIAPVQQLYADDYLAPIQSWLHASRPWTRYTPTLLVPSADVVSELAEMLVSAESPLLCVGRLDTQYEAEAAVKIATAFGLPIVTDIASGLRLGISAEHHSEDICFLPYFDHILLAPHTLDSVKPDLVLHIGGAFVSKRLLQWFDRVRPQEYVVIEKTPFRHDPNHQVTMRLQADIPAIAPMLQEASRKQKRSVSSVPKYVQHLAALSGIVETTLNETLAQQERTNAPMTEIAVANIVSGMIPDGNGLFISNSMPIRDMDMYAAVRDSSTTIAVGTNRGASGIDGIVASAAGFARGLGQPTTLIIGDVALVHDLNSLLLVAKNHVPLVIVAVNNAGGGIFSFLPIAAHTDIFEPFWGTPHNADFKAGAAFAGLHYALAEKIQDFRTAYTSALHRAQKDNTSTLLEIRTGRTENFDEHKRLQALITSRLQGYTA